MHFKSRMLNIPKLVCSLPPSLSLSLHKAEALEGLARATVLQSNSPRQKKIYNFIIIKPSSLFLSGLLSDSLIVTLFLFCFVFV